VRVTPHLNLMDRLEAASNPARTPTVCELCITHRVLDVLVSHPRLDGPSVFASAYDAVHSRVNIKREIRTSDECVAACVSVDTHWLCAVLCSQRYLRIKISEDR
jgi:hypothetical protein